MWMLGSTSLTMLHTLLWLCYVHAWFRLFEFNNSWLILVVTSQVWWPIILEVKSFVNAPLHASRIKLGQLAQLASSIKWNNTDVNTNVNIKIRHFFSSFAAFVSSLWLRLFVFFFFFFFFLLFFMWLMLIWTLLILSLAAALFLILFLPSVVSADIPIFLLKFYCPDLSYMSRFVFNFWETLAETSNLQRFLSIVQSHSKFSLFGLV